MFESFCTTSFPSATNTYRISCHRQGHALLLRIDNAICNGIRMPSMAFKFNCQTKLQNRSVTKTIVQSNLRSSSHYENVCNDNSHESLSDHREFLYKRFFILQEHLTVA